MFPKCVHSLSSNNWRYMLIKILLLILTIRALSSEYEEEDDNNESDISWYFVILEIQI